MKSAICSDISSAPTFCIAYKNSNIPAKENIENLSYDKETIELYKAIPVNGACSIDELTEKGYKTSFVMKALLKLEMGGFVTMLPGEKVKRNI